MAIGRTNAGGGGVGGLNFRVVGATSAPSNPAENTIWINTGTAITSWAFSATAPAVSASGMVWISTGSASNLEFNAVKNNALQVYPLSAQQYVNGAWVDVNGAIYLDGAWVNWETEEPGLYWFEKGILNENVGKSHEVGTGSWYTFDNTAGYFENRIPTNNNCYMRTPNKLDITDFKAIVLKCEEQTGGTVQVGLAAKSDISDVVAVGEKSTTGAGTIRVEDIASISGSYYLFYKAAAGSGGSATIKASDIYLV